jgi:hypothetical protein
MLLLANWQAQFSSNQFDQPGRGSSQRYVMRETHETPKDNKDELRCCSVADIKLEFQCIK